MKLFALLLASLPIAAAADFRLGIIGTDTSHASVFTKAFNDPADPNYVNGFRVVAAYKGGSQDIKESRERLEKIAIELHDKYGVEIVPDIAALAQKVDGILLESVDGRTHLPQLKAALAARKPIFIDKPLAATYEDAKEIARLAREAGVKWWSASALRFVGAAPMLKANDIVGAVVWGPSPLEEHHPLDLAWYGIHPTEMLFTLLGTGCEEVTVLSTPNADVVTGRWRDGRLGTIRALRPYSEYGAVVFRGPKQLISQSPEKVPFGYAPLLQKIASFFQTGEPGVANEETLAMFAFMDAAQRSKASGGKPAAVR